MAKKVILYEQGVQILPATAIEQVSGKANNSDMDAATNDTMYTTPAGVKHSIDTHAMSAIRPHIADKNNPHGVTAAQTGAYWSGNSNKSDVNWTANLLTANKVYAINNVGVNIANPTEALHVVGNGLFTGTGKFGGDIQSGGNILAKTDVVAYSSQTDVRIDPQTGASYLYELGDVSISEPKLNDFLVYNADKTNPRWVNKSASILKLATLDVNSKIPLSQLPDSIIGGMVYQGTWNAATNTPNLTTVPAKGQYYIVSTEGTQFNKTWHVGDWIVSHGDVWDKIDNTDQVNSVAGKTGVVVLDKNDVGLGNVRNVAQLGQTETAADSNKLGGIAAANYYHSGNSNKSDVDWTCKDLLANGRIISPYTSIGTNGADEYFEVVPKFSSDTGYRWSEALRFFKANNSWCFGSSNKPFYHAGNSNKSDVDWQAKTLVGGYGADSGLRIGRTLDCFTINKVDTKTVFTHREDDTDANNGWGFFDFFVDSPSSIDKIRFLFRDRSNEYLRIMGSRRIGIYNSNPTEMLDVSGNILAANMFIGNATTKNQVYHAGNSNKSDVNWTANTVYARTYRGTATAANTAGASLDLMGSNGVGVDKAGGGVYIYGGKGTGNQYGGVIGFFTSTKGTTSGSTSNSSIRRMTITQDGNVGIGTETPTEKLDVVGNIKSSGYLTVPLIKNDGIGGTLELKSATSTLVLSDDGIPQLITNSTQDGTFEVQGHQLVCKNLDVLGDTSSVNINASGMIKAGGDVVAYSTQADVLMDQAASGASSLIDLSDVNISNPAIGQTIVWNPTTQKWENKEINWNNLSSKPTEFTPVAHDHTGGSFSVSDKRLKLNIQPIANVQLYIKALEPVKYDWKPEAKSKYGVREDVGYGFIAQEVEKIIPDAVRKLEDGEHLGINYEKIIPFLVGSMQEMMVEIRELKEEIVKLKNK